jgi:hypothetical protein
MPAHALPGAATGVAAHVRLKEECGDGGRSLIHIGNEKAALAVLDLTPDAADIAADDRSALPHGLGHRQAEAFPERLLQYYRRPALQCVDKQLQHAAPSKTDHAQSASFG